MKPYLLRLLSRPKLNMRFKIEPEQLESIKLADVMRELTMSGDYKGYWFHIANEGKRHQIVGMILKAMGMIPGAPDYIFRFSGKLICIELKIKPNKQTDNQKDFQQWVEDCGDIYKVCYSAEEALDFLASNNAFAPTA